MKLSPLHVQALKYSELYGFSIIPVGKNKKPLLSSWKEFQTRKSTEEEINVWWNKYPNANIGIATGIVSGVTVVDVDVHKGGDPTPFPKTYTVKTGNGGLQLYYKYQEGLSISANAYPQFPFVDIRSDGGYVVAPPSVTDYLEKGIKKGGQYTVIDSCPFAPFPIKLFPTTKKKKNLSSLVGVSTGSRNSSMASLIGTLILPMSEDRFLTDGWNAIVDINKTYNPPLPIAELKTTFDSIVEKERQRRFEKYKNLENLDLLHTIKNKTKVFTLNTENICRILRKHPDFQSRFRYDVFRNTFQIKENSIWRDFEGNSDAISILTQISILFPFFQKVGKDMVYDALIKVSKENTIDSASDFIRSLVWDKIPRLATWLNIVYGAPDDILYRAIGSNWLKGMVKRLIEPGCKFDFVLVLEGAQGVKKSTSLSILGGSWHVETTMSTDTKDFFMQFEGKSIIEFSEGETLSRTEVKRMKAIITMQSDKYRPPYERVSRDFPRRCVFAMTTNQTEYLKDETGNRRWLPVPVTLPHANVEWLMNNREQLFAEAYHRVFNLKETVYEFPEKEILEAQQKRRIQDPNADLIANWYYNDITKETRDAGITVHQVYRDALYGKYPNKVMNTYEAMSIASVLKDHLKLIKKDSIRNGLRAMRWFNPNPEETQTEDEILEDAVYKFKTYE